MKRGQIWISAVLYIAIGIIVITIILAASIPLIDKTKDRNTVAETKNLLLTIDETINIVAREGPGSQRELSPLTINEGALMIDEVNNNITWMMATTARILEPDTPIQEGVLALYLETTNVKDEFLMSIAMNYNDTIDLDLDSDYQPPYTGRYSAVIMHSGTFTTNNKGEDIPVIDIRIL
jgi:hypothetical protein